MSGFGTSPYGISSYGFGSSAPVPKIAIPHISAYESVYFTFYCDVWLTSASDQNVVGKYGEWMIDVVGGNFQASLWQGGSAVTTATTPVETERWVSLVVYFTSGRLFLYVDNSYIGYCGAVGTPRDISTLDWGFYHSGSARRARFWSVQVSSVLLADLFNDNIVPSTSFIQGEWLLTDGASGVATDTSLNANDGTISAGTWYGGQQDGFNSGSVWAVPVDGAITDALHWIMIFGGFWVLDTSLPIDGTPSGFTFHDDYPTSIPAFTVIHRFGAMQFRVGPPKPPGLVLGVTYQMMAVEKQVHEQSSSARIGRGTKINGPAGTLTHIGREDGTYAYAQDVLDLSIIADMTPGIYYVQDGPFLGYEFSVPYSEYHQQFTNCIVDSGRLIDYDYRRQGIVEGMQCIINNVRYTVDSINTFGEITLDSAPPNGTGVTADFYLVGFRYVKPAVTDIGFGV